jgi:hypothetical protein
MIGESNKCRGMRSGNISRAERVYLCSFRHQREGNQSYTILYSGRILESGTWPLQSSEAIRCVPPLFMFHVRV